MAFSNAHPDYFYGGLLAQGSLRPLKLSRAPIRNFLSIGVITQGPRSKVKSGRADN